eukprot:6364037-Prymnesium_polylepis.1
MTFRRMSAILPSSRRGAAWDTQARRRAWACRSSPSSPSPRSPSRRHRCAPRRSSPRRTSATCPPTRHSSSRRRALRPSRWRGVCCCSWWQAPSPGSFGHCYYE